MACLGPKKSARPAFVCCKVSPFSDRQLRESLGLITKIWFERTTPQDPWLVLRDVPEAQALEEMCRALDIRWHRETNTDLIMQTQPAVVKVYMTGTPATALLQYLQRAGVPAFPRARI